jgi:hypothetical protein
MAENIKTLALTNLDATPQIYPTTGEGGPGYLKMLTDSLAPSSAVAQWSTYRLARFPTNSKVKRVWTYLSGIDTNATPTATFDYNIAFSDDNNDGTQVALQATIPSNKRDGTSLAFVLNTGYATTYANAGTGNKLFGTVAGSASGATQNTEITFKNVTAAQGFFPVNRDDDLWNIQGFLNAQGTAADPGGFFDIFVVVATAVATAAAGVIGVEVDFVL